MRTTGCATLRLVSGEPPSAVLDFRNNVVYDASKYFSHSGHGAVCANWINNYYKHGPSTPEKLRGEMFRFEHNPDSRMFADGNFIFAFPQATQNNWLAVRYEKTLTPDNEKTMRVERPFDAVATNTQSAAEAYEVVLAEAGATLPSRDAVDLRIVNDVRNGTGHVIEKETDLPPDQRWPQYVAAPRRRIRTPTAFRITGKSSSAWTGTIRPTAWPFRPGATRTSNTTSTTPIRRAARRRSSLSPPAFPARPGEPCVWRVTRTGSTARAAGRVLHRRRHDGTRRRIQEASGERYDPGGEIGRGHFHRARPRCAERKGQNRLRDSHRGHEGIPRGLSLGGAGGDRGLTLAQPAKLHHPMTIFDSIALRARSRSVPVCCM